MLSKTVIVNSTTGIHARPATLLVQTATKYDASINLIYKEKKVNMRSIMGLMSLGIPKNAEVTLEVSGSDEEAALETISTLISGSLE